MRDSNPLAIGWLALHLLSWRAALLAVTTLGFLLRAFKLGAQELRGDEAFSYLFVQRPLVDIIPGLARHGDPHSPLHYLLLYGWIELAGDSEYAMRYLSLLPGVLVLPLLAQMGRVLHSRHLGLLTALLAALSQSLVWIAQDVRNQYTLAVLFAVLATWLLLQLSRETPAAGRRPFHWLGYAATGGLLLYSHYYGIFALVGHGLYLLVDQARRSWLWAWGLSGVVIALLFLPWLVVVWSPLVAAGQLSDLGRPDAVQYLVAIGVESAGISALGEPLAQWFGAGALTLALLGLWSFLRRRAAAAVLLSGWLFSAVLVIYLLQYVRATFNPFYVSVAAPAWWALAAMGLLTLWQGRSHWQPALAGASMIGLVVGSSISLHNYYFEPMYSRSNGYRSLAEHVGAHWQPGDLFLAHGPDPAFGYYLRGLPVDYEMQPVSLLAPPEETQAQLADLAAQYTRFWFVPYEGSSWDAGEAVPQWLEQHALLEKQVQHHWLTLQAYRPYAAIERQQMSVDRTVNDKIRLASALIRADDGQADSAGRIYASPGTDITVILIWEALEVVPESYTTFVHLLGADGRLVTQHDGIPVFGHRPTSTWQVDERLYDLHRLVLPVDVTTDRGQLLVGMYHTETIERQLFDHGEDVVHLADVDFR